jgi:hypothetical protein
MSDDLRDRRATITASKTSLKISMDEKWHVAAFSKLFNLSFKRIN